MMTTLTLSMGWLMLANHSATMALARCDPALTLVVVRIGPGPDQLIWAAFGLARVCGSGPSAGPSFRSRPLALFTRFVAAIHPPGSFFTSWPRVPSKNDEGLDQARLDASRSPSHRVRVGGYRA